MCLILSYWKNPNCTGTQRQKNVNLWSWSSLGYECHAQFYFILFFFPVIDHADRINLLTDGFILFFFCAWFTDCYIKAKVRGLFKPSTGI